MSREEDLDAHLKTLGLERRPDSRLCEAFIKGDLDDSYSAAKVAETIAVHRWLYEYTSYSTLCAMHIPKLAACLAPCMGGYRAAYRYVSSNEAPRLKALASELAGGVPEKWPWMP